MNKPKLLLLSALCLLLMLLCACGAETPPVETTTDTTVTETTAPAASEEPTLTLVQDGKCLYDVIRDDDLDTASLVVTQARNVLKYIQKLTGASGTLSTDWSKRGYELDPEKYEILVGYTDHPETQQVVSELSYGEYAIRAIGNKIVIFGFNDTSLSQAVNRFNRALEKCVSEDGKSITIRPSDIELREDHDLALNALPKYEDGTFGSYYKAGNDVDEIIIRDTTPDEYRAYLGTLEQNGFVKYTDHQITDNLFATYTNEKYTVTAGYYAYETSVRLLIEPLAPAVGLASENVYTPVTTSQITMLGTAFTGGNGNYNGNGLSVLIRLTDGRFIVVDGGFNREAHATQLLREMKEQSADYAKTSKDITVAAWIITHPHGDHDGMIIGYHNTFRAITVERFLVNFLSETELTKSDNSSKYGGNWSAGEGYEYLGVLDAAKALDATVHQIHVGQVFYMADLKMEVLYTVESFGPETCNALNTTSTVLRMEFGGETVYMCTGDATGHGMEICTKMYGDYMQSDLVQVCHHGYGTWGNDTGMVRAYRAINATGVLWPQGLSHFDTHQSIEYNAVLFEVPNYREVYVSGEEGHKVIVPIPYVVGNGIVER